MDKLRADAEHLRWIGLRVSGGRVAQQLRDLERTTEAPSSDDLRYIG